MMPLGGEIRLKPRPSISSPSAISGVCVGRNRRVVILAAAVALLAGSELSTAHE